MAKGAFFSYGRIIWPRNWGRNLKSFGNKFGVNGRCKFKFMKLFWIRWNFLKVVLKPGSKFLK